MCLKLTFFNPTMILLKCVDLFFYAIHNFLLFGNFYSASKSLPTNITISELTSSSCTLSWTPSFYAAFSTSTVKFTITVNSTASSGTNYNTTVPSYPRLLAEFLYTCGVC